MFIEKRRVAAQEQVSISATSKTPFDGFLTRANRELIQERSDKRSKATSMGQREILMVASVERLLIKILGRANAIKIFDQLDERVETAEKSTGYTALDRTLADILKRDFGLSFDALPLDAIAADEWELRSEQKIRHYLGGDLNGVFDFTTKTG